MGHFSLHMFLAEKITHAMCVNELVDAALAVGGRGILKALPLGHEA